MTREELRKAIKIELNKNIQQFELNKCPGRIIITQKVDAMLHMYRRLQS